MRVRLPLSLVVVLYTSVGCSECQRSACGTSAGQSAVYLQSAKKNIATVFHSVKATRLGGPQCFLNLPQMRTNQNENGTVKWFFHEYFETIGRFSLRDF